MAMALSQNWHGSVLVLFFCRRRLRFRFLERWAPLRTPRGHATARTAICEHSRYRCRNTLHVSPRHPRPTRETCQLRSLEIDWGTTRQVCQRTPAEHWNLGWLPRAQLAPHASSGLMLVACAGPDDVGEGVAELRCVVAGRCEIGAACQPPLLVVAAHAMPGARVHFVRKHARPTARPSPGCRL